MCKIKSLRNLGGLGCIIVYRHYVEKFMWLVGGQHTPTVEMYDCEKNTWSFVASFAHIRRNSVRLMKYGEKIICFGESNPSILSEIYHPDEDLIILKIVLLLRVINNYLKLWALSR